MRELHALAETDPARAIALAHQLGRTDEEKSTWVADLARQWTERAPQTAWDWLAQQTQSRLRDLATGTLPSVIIETIARRDPALLVHNLDVLVRRGETPLGVAPVVAVHLGLDALVASSQLDLARRTVETWTADPTRPAIGEAAYAVIADALRTVDPLAAGDWLTRQPRSAAHDTALVEFPARWAATDPHGALAWVEAHVPAGLRAAAVQRAFGDWAERSPAAAGEWLGGYLSRASPGPETDRLVTALVNLGPVVKTNPALALQWTQLATEPATRAQLEERIIARWARQDRAAAVAYLWQTATLPAGRKAALAQRIHDPTFAQFEE